MSNNISLLRSLLLTEEYFRRLVPFSIRTSRDSLLSNYYAILNRKSWITNILETIPHSYVDPMTFRIREIYFNYELSALIELLQKYSVDEMPTDLLYALRRLLLIQQRKLIKELEQNPEFS